MMNLLSFLLIILLFGVLTMGWMAYRVWRTLHQITGRSSQFKTRNEAPKASGPNGEHISDYRSDEEASRKIIPKGEGEYVNFTIEEGDDTTDKN